MFVWYILLGALVLTVGLIAAVWVLPAWVAGQFEHGNTCDCNECMRRRAKKWDRLNSQKETMWGRDEQFRPAKEITDTEMVSTRELNTNDLVTGKELKEWYMVLECNVREYSWALVLTNVKTGKLSWITIRNDRLDVKLWTRRRNKHRKGHVHGA